MTFCPQRAVASCGPKNPCWRLSGFYTCTSSGQFDCYFTGKRVALVSSVVSRSLRHMVWCNYGSGPKLLSCQKSSTNIDYWCSKLMNTLPAIELKTPTQAEEAHMILLLSPSAGWILTSHQLNQGVPAEGPLMTPSRKLLDQARTAACAG